MTRYVTIHKLEWPNTNQKTTWQRKVWPQGVQPTRSAVKNYGKQLADKYQDEISKGMVLSEFVHVEEKYAQEMDLTMPPLM